MKADKLRAPGRKVTAPPPPRPLPDWVVTATHRVRGDWPDEGLLPWGTRHARGAGDSTTLCGLNAIEWPMFWHITFDPARHDSCPACARGLATLKLRGPSANNEPSQPQNEPTDRK